MKKLLLLIPIAIIVLVLLAIIIYFGQDRSACGIKGCYNTCNENADCKFYEGIGDCRGLNFENSKEDVTRSHKVYPIGTECECLESGIIKVCRAKDVELIE